MAIHIHRLFDEMAEAMPMGDASTFSCTEALNDWVTCFGFFDDLTSDRGPAFICHLWAALAHLMETNINTMTGYNPAANSMT